MARTDDASVKAQIAKLAIIYYDCVSIQQVQNGVTRVYRNTNAPFDITLPDGVYKAAGNLMSIENIEENVSFEIQKLSIGFNALSQDDGFGNPVLSTMMADTTVYIDQPVTVTRVFLNADNTVDNSFEIFNGTVSDMQVSTSVTNERSIAILASSHWVDFSRVNSKRTNTNSHNSRSILAGQPEDKGFDYAIQTLKDIEWKKE